LEDTNNETFKVIRFLLVPAVVFIGTGTHRALVFNVFSAPPPRLAFGTIGFADIGDGFVGSAQADGTGNALYRTKLTGGGVAVFAPTVDRRSTFQPEVVPTNITFRGSNLASAVMHA
jgi:hypothetical protein